jgi:hypothetical protein
MTLASHKYHDHLHYSVILRYRIKRPEVRGEACIFRTKRDVFTVLYMEVQRDIAEQLQECIKIT